MRNRANSKSDGTEFARFSTSFCGASIMTSRRRVCQAGLSRSNLAVIESARCTAGAMGWMWIQYRLPNSHLYIVINLPHSQSSSISLSPLSLARATRSAIFARAFFSAASSCANHTLSVHRRKWNGRRRTFPDFARARHSAWMSPKWLCLRSAFSNCIKERYQSSPEACSTEGHAPPIALASHSRPRAAQPGPPRARRARPAAPARARP